MSKKQNKEREQAPRKPKKPERKPLFFDRFMNMDWKVFVPLKSKKEIRED